MITNPFTLEIELLGHMRRLVAENIDRHHAAKGVSDEMDLTSLVETGVVSTPQSIHTVGLLYDGFDHHGFVMGEVVWDIQHDVADQIPNRRYRFGSDVF